MKTEQAGVPSTAKKRTLDDYFGKPKTRPDGIDSITGPDIKASNTSLTDKELKTDTGTTSVPGLSIRTNFVTASEQRSLLTFLLYQQWRNDLSRRTIHYGGTYCLMAPKSATPSERSAIEKTIITASPIPSELYWLIDRMVSQGFYSSTKKPAFCIVNEYLPGHGIAAHVENFRFDAPVCSLTLGDGDFMRFHELASADDGSVRSGKAAQAPRTGKNKHVWLPSGSLAVLSGDGGGDGSMRLRGGG